MFSLIYFLLAFNFSCTGVLPEYLYVCHMHAWCAQILEEKVSLPESRDLGVLVIHPVGAENGTRIFWKSHKHFFQFCYIAAEASRHKHSFFLFLFFFF